MEKLIMSCTTAYRMSFMIYSKILFGNNSFLLLPHLADRRSSYPTRDNIYK